MAPPISSAPDRAPIAAETSTPGALRLKDIVRCIPRVELNPRFATGVPDTRNQGLALAPSGKVGEAPKNTHKIRIRRESCFGLAHNPLATRIR